jgi:hypothetical protein
VAKKRLLLLLQRLLLLPLLHLLLMLHLPLLLLHLLLMPLLLRLLLPTRSNPSGLCKSHPWVAFFWPFALKLLDPTCFFGDHLLLI